MKQANFDDVPKASVIALILEPDSGEPSSGTCTITQNGPLYYSDGSCIPDGNTVGPIQIVEGVLALMLPLTLGGSQNSTLGLQNYSVVFTLESGTYEETWSLPIEVFPNGSRLSRDQVVTGSCPAF